MTVGPQRFQYPKTPEEAKGTWHETTHRIHGSNDPETLFKGHVTASAPWERAGRSKVKPLYDRERVSAALSEPSRHMREVDPRFLHSNQPEVTRAGVNYYMGDEYRKTGRTFADMHMAGNRFPVVYSDQRGRNIILSGHHRATAALLRGEQFRAIHVQE